MDRDDFWDLIGAARSAGSCTASATALRAGLSRLPSFEIVEFDRHLQACLAELYTWDLWAVAFIVQGGCSDDGFEYFRAGVILRGRAEFEAARTDPDGWALMLDPGAADLLGCEDLLYVAAQAHEQATGSPLPASDVAHPSEPRGTAWDEDDVDTLHPELAERYGGGPVLEIGPSGDRVHLGDQSELLSVTEAYYRGDWPEAARIGAEIVAADPADRHLLGVAGAIAGHARFHLDDLDGAIEYLIPALTAADRRDGPALVLDDLCGFAYTASMALFLRGRTTEARELLADTVRYTEERGAVVPDQVPRALAQFDMAVGDYSSARARLGVSPLDWLLVAKAYALEDRAAEAGDVLDQLEHQLTPELVDPRTLAGMLAVAAEVRLRMGDPAGASRHLDAADALLGPADADMPTAVDLRLLRLMTERAAGSTTGLLDALADVDRRAEDLALAWTAAAARREQARVLRMEGDEDEARRAFAAAAEAFGAGGYPAEADDTRQEGDSGR